MKRRSFLQWCLGVLGVGTVGVPAVKAKPNSVINLDCKREECLWYGGLGVHGCDDPMNQTCCKLKLIQGMVCLRNQANPPYYQKSTPKEWRKWATLEKEPRAYTQEDIDSACAENHLMCGEDPTKECPERLANQMNETQDRLIRDVIAKWEREKRKAYGLS